MERKQVQRRFSGFPWFHGAQKNFSTVQCEILKFAVCLMVWRYNNFCEIIKWFVPIQWLNRFENNACDLNIVRINGIEEIKNRRGYGPGNFVIEKAVKTSQFIENNTARRASLQVSSNSFPICFFNDPIRHKRFDKVRFRARMLCFVFHRRLSWWTLCPNFQKRTYASCQRLMHWCKSKRMFVLPKCISPFFLNSNNIYLAVFFIVLYTDKPPILRKIIIIPSIFFAVIS